MSTRVGSPRRRARSVIVAATTLASCSSPTQGTDPDAPAAILVEPATAIMVSVGDTLQLSAEVRNAGGQTLSAAVTWASDAASVAEVDASGRVVATGNGMATITASAATLSATSSVTVEQRIDSVVVSGDAQSGDVGHVLESPIGVTLLDARRNPIAGAPVSFAAAAGTVGDAQATTDAQGAASTAWTLGTASGLQEIELVAGFGGEATRTLSAYGYALDAETLTLLSGDDQTELAGLPLPEPLRVRALDMYGNGVPDMVVRFTVDGDASLDEAAITTDLDGVASAVLTLGGAPGAYTATATVPDSLTVTGLPLAGSPVTFSADAVTYTLDAVAALTVGDTVTLTGSGFHAVPDSNAVTVDGLSAAIVEGSQNELRIEVPDFGCAPLELRTLSVSRTAASVSQPVEVTPAGALTLAVGERIVLSDPDGFCLQLLPGSDDEYLVGLTAARWLDASTTFSLTGADSVGPAPAPAGVAPLLGGGLARPSPVNEIGEMRLRRSEAALLDRIASAVAAPPAPAQAPPAPGDLLDVRLPDLRADPCTVHLSLAAEVFSVGARLTLATSLDLPDPGDPGMVDLMMAADTLHTKLGDTGVDVLLDLLGTPPGWDGETRVLVVLTPDVELMDVPAYASAVDVLPSTTCPSSNERAVVYVAVPAAATAGDIAGVLAASAPELTHHIAHIVQWGRRLGDGGNLLPNWLAEGQAELAVEAVGLALGGLGPQQELGSTVLSLPGLVDWVGARFDRLALFNGWDGAAGTVAGAPEGCSLFGFGGPSSPCDPEAAPGAAWSFLRHISDRFAPTFPGGEAGLHRAIVGLDSSGDAVALLEALLGASLSGLVVDWAAALYVDGRLTPAEAPDLQITSWKLLELLPSGPKRLAPASFGFTDFMRSGSLVGGGTAYSLVTSAGAHGPLALSARDGWGTPISEMLEPRLWIVRLR